MRRRLLLPSLVVTLLAGCSLTTDLSGLSDPLLVDDDDEDGEIRTEAGADAPGEGSADAAADTSSTVDGPGPEASGCARHPGATFCVDFEQPAPLSLATWTEVDDASKLPATSSMTLTQQAFSPTNAVLFDVAGGGSDCKYLRLVKRVMGTYAQVTTRYELRAETTGLFFAESFDVQPGLSFSLIVAVGNGTHVRLFGQQNLNNNITEIGAVDMNTESSVLGRWAPFSIEYTSTPTKKATLVVGNDKVSLPLPAAFVARDPYVAIGPYCSGPAHRAAVDDFAIFATP